MNCRHCHRPLEYIFLDLGFAPPSNAYLSAEQLQAPERYYPLKLFVCTNCWLVQTDDYTEADQLFSADYAYFSSVSRSWLDHAKHYTQMIIARLNLRPDSLIIEVASNDGYLLKNFVEADIPCLGIEPTISTATACEKLGIPVLRQFFGQSLAQRLASEGKKADLIIGNNVFAHVPDINDFTLGLKAALKPDGTISLEFPHLMQLIEHTQFDTVYHEHFSYLSLYTVMRIFAAANLRVYDVEELPTHGGSLRVFGCHANDARDDVPTVAALLEKENQRGLRSLETYQAFQPRADTMKDDLLLFLIEQKRLGKRIAGYGAAAKGNTLLNYGGVKPDLLPFICDAAPSKQGKFIPGAHIPIVGPDALQREKPDYIIILPWNIAQEVIEQQAEVRAWGGRFVTCIPKLHVIG